MLIFNSVYVYKVNPALMPWYLTESAQLAFNVLLWGGFVCIFGYMIWMATRKQISRFLPLKEKNVEIQKIIGADLKANSGQVSLPSKTKVKVSYQNHNRTKKKTLYANRVGVQEGDLGILRYRGVFCESFIKKGSLKEDNVDRYYHFGFEKSKKQITIQTERKKRKYW